MSDSGANVQATLETWRHQGADRMDPLRFQRIEALAHRTAGQHGALRRLLDARLAELVGAYAADLAAGSGCGTRHNHDATTVERPGSALSALLEHLARQTMARGHSGSDAPAALSASALDPLDDVRRICTHARSESQLRQALEPAPENAGPLNSTSLVHRALTLMRAASPEYLQPFMAYVDTLARLEQLGVRGAQTEKRISSAASGAKRPRGKSRGRRD